MLRHRILRTLTVVAALSLHVSCAREASGIAFWSGDAVVKRESDFTIDPSRQLESLRRATPESDAEKAFARSDLRLVSVRHPFALFPGVPDDRLVSSLYTNYGYKVIGYSKELLSNSEFVELRSDYAYRFNSKLYQLVLSAP